MFENVIETSIFVRILIFAFVSILTINLVMLITDFILGARIKRERTAAHEQRLAALETENGF